MEEDEDDSANWISVEDESDEMDIDLTVMGQNVFSSARDVLQRDQRSTIAEPELPEPDEVFNVLALCWQISCPRRLSGGFGRVHTAIRRRKAPSRQRAAIWRAQSFALFDAGPSLPNRCNSSSSSSCL